MIALALLGAAIFPGRFVELPMKDADHLSISVVAPLDRLGAHDRAVVDILSRTILQGCDQFSKDDIRNLTIQTGTAAKCFAMPDHIRIQIDVPASNWKEGLLLARSAIENANLTDASIDEALQTAPYLKPGYWQMALRPLRNDFEKLKHSEVRDAYSYIFRPENVSIAVSGPFAAGTARDYWSSLFLDWVPRRRKAPLPGVGPELGPSSSDQPISTIELAGQTIEGSSTKLPSRILAMFSLGVGKQSAVFRVIRDKLAFSYRQEAFLWPVPGGFQPRIIFATKPSEVDPKKADLARIALLEDIPNWSEEERARAMAMASSVFLRGLPLNPILTQPGGVIENQDDRTFMAAYWFPKTGRYWSEKDLVKELSLVTLDQLKDAAHEIVRGATGSLIGGR